MRQKTIHFLIGKQTIQRLNRFVQSLQTWTKIQVSHSRKIPLQKNQLDVSSSLELSVDSEDSKDFETGCKTISPSCARISW